MHLFRDLRSPLISGSSRLTSQSHLLKTSADEDDSTKLDQEARVGTHTHPTSAAAVMGNVDFALGGSFVALRVVRKASAQNQGRVRSRSNVSLRLSLGESNKTVSIPIVSVSMSPSVSPGFLVTDATVSTWTNKAEKITPLMRSVQTPTAEAVIH